MLINEYRQWLISNNVSSYQTFIGKLQRIEKYEGDIDECYKNDKCIQLLSRLTYSTSDQNSQKKPLHNIPIDPDNNDLYKSFYDSTRDYKSRLNKYIEFLNVHNWDNTFCRNKSEIIFSDDINVGEHNTYIEGATKQIVVNAYERNPIARKDCIKSLGFKCIICGFDFGEFYGKQFSGKIHIHHKKPLHELDKAYELNPQIDLAPVCPNCHLILHSKNNGTYTIDEVKGFICNNKK
ncbi:MAG: hypothetical protein K0Q87_3389 [Neobacillus sp.]|jgi:hypothetical protein|nr:hypothetical protein [Neobacillus sp.]